MLFITLVLFVAVLLGLNYLYRSTQKLGQTVFVGLLLGLVGGALLQSLSEQETVKTALDQFSGRRLCSLTPNDCNAVGVRIDPFCDYAFKSSRLIRQNQF